MGKFLNFIKSVLSSYEFFFTVVIIFYELFFHFLRFEAVSGDIAGIVFLSIAFGAAAGIVTSFLKDKGKVIYTIIVLVVIYLFFVAHLMYSHVFNSYLSISGVGGMTGQAFTNFGDLIWSAFVAKLPVILIWLIPIIFYAVIGRKIIYKGKRKPVAYSLEALFLMIFTFYIYLFFIVTGKGDDSAYAMLKNYDSVERSVQRLGVIRTTFLDAEYGIKRATGNEKKEAEFAEQTYVPEFDMETTTVTEATTAESKSTEATTEATTEEATIDMSPNTLDIDFEAVNAAANSGAVTSINEYLQNAQCTNRNEYTGMFEGYNTIFIVAEGFDGFVIDQKLTPTLYKMTHQGFWFKNFYTPLWYGSTSGGEYADLVGLMPRNGGYLSMNKVGSTGAYMPFTLCNQSKRNGYNTFGFHDNYYDYYNRNVSHPKLGYDNWLGIGNGMEYEKTSGGGVLWPQSDYFMEQNTFDIYKDEEPFHVYYLTVSGHVQYNFGGNAMSARHKDIVEDLPYSDGTKAYIACQYELELMLSALLEDLEKEGIADHTVIALVADHVPYGNKEIVDELSGKMLDNTFGWYKNTFILYSEGMDHGVPVDKVCMSLDVLPTLSNLMGFDYDSRMLAGQDILSGNEGLVIMNDGSFITDRCRYNSNTGEVDGDVPDEYIDYYKNVVKNKKNMSDMILVNNYYKYIKDYIPGEGEDEE
ncbi:MAG: sulfatase-like hydrolase/transferase [Eubacterium sp.]|nr:sulfatase-like hydrolase/transferase [Eubacterium sp.]